MKTRLTFATLALLAFTACGSRPVQTLDEADKALQEAILAKKCAPEEYAAAERMYEKAKKQADDGQNDEAKASALAARKLAEKARDKAASVKEECLKVKPTEGDTQEKPEFVDPTAATDSQAEATGSMETIFFEFNSFDLTADARQNLTRNAEWLRKKGDARVVLGGHCDKRGSTEYNLALGEKRALVVRKYLQSLGIEESRMEILSYGEEQPLASGEGEASFSQNRRVEFTVR